MLNRYPNAREVVWCQEEPQNQGAWYQIRHRLQELCWAAAPVLYAGRAPAAAPATGIAKIHEIEQHALVGAALHSTATEESARETTRLTRAAGRGGRGRGAAAEPPPSRLRCESVMSTEIRVPQLPESVADATLVAWHKQPGEADPSRRESRRSGDRQGRARGAGAGQRRGARAQGQSGTVVTSGQLLAVIEEGAAADAAPQAARRQHAAAASAPRAAAPTAPRAGSAMPRSSVPPCAGWWRRTASTPAPSRPPAATGASPSRTSSVSWARSLRKPHRSMPAAPAGPAAAPAPSPPAPAGARAEQRVPMTRLRAAHRAAPGGGAVDPGAAHDLQRGRSHRSAGAARALQGALREGAGREARLHVVLRQGDRSRRSSVSRW